MGAESSAELHEQIPLDGMRGLIARRLTESLREMAQLTLHHEIDAAPIIEFRRASVDSQHSINDVVLTAVAHTLAHHPAVNATLENDIILRWRSVNLGTAVAVDAGLVVPVIKNADKLSLKQLGVEAERLTTLARSGGLSIADMQNGTFTVSNLGAFGIDGFTPIINPPQVAILGVGRIRREAAMTLSLTIDHRALDGVPGARFLQDLTQLLENPGDL
jgi:pyruvate dehydrogenase E2 component (dihydrolipoamide acetyltransferase)